MKSWKRIVIIEKAAAVISCQLLEPTEIQIVKVSENVLSDCSDAVLRHATKHRIPDK